MKAFLLSLLFALPAHAEAHAASCGRGQSKFLFDKSTRFQDRIFFENVSLCLSGSRFRIVAERASPHYGSGYQDLTIGLCKAMGYRKTVSVDAVSLRQLEKLAYFAEDGKFTGVLLTGPGVEWRYEVVGSVTCEL